MGRRPLRTIPMAIGDDPRDKRNKMSKHLTRMVTALIINGVASQTSPDHPQHVIESPNLFLKQILYAFSRYQEKLSAWQCGSKFVANSGKVSCSMILRKGLKESCPAFSRSCYELS